jgi:serine phosphatase RsbU (regulator of sigma subunit)
LRETIRNQSGNEAEQIKAAVIESVDAFRGSAAQEDDITLVVIKVL